MRRSVFLALCLLVMAIARHSAVARAADDKPRLKEKLIAAIKIHLREKTDRQQTVFQQHMQIKLAEMRQICELDDSQVKRLEIASKGAIERFTEKWLDTTAEWLARQAGDPDGDDDVEKMAADAADDDVMQQFELVIGVGVVTDAICREPVWGHSLAKTLSADQLETCERIESRRQAKRRSSSIAYLVSILDQEYLLSEDQQEKFRPMIEKVIERNHLQNFRGTMLGSFLLSIHLYKIPKDDLATVLTPEQLKIWDTKIKQYADYFEMDNDELYGPWRELLANEPRG